MKIAAHLGVLDEAELIERCIAHLRQIGVGEFYVCDLGSTDGTEDILLQMEGEDFHLLHMSNADAGEAWIARNNDFIAGCAADLEKSGRSLTADAPATRVGSAANTGLRARA